MPEELPDPIPPSDNVVSLAAARQQRPRTNKSQGAKYGGPPDSFATLYIFPAWRALRDAVGG